MARRIEIITFECERIVPRATTVSCAECTDGSQLLTTSHAAVIARVEVKTIHRWIADERMHGSTTNDGQYRICKNSLLELIDLLGGGEGR